MTKRQPKTAAELMAELSQDPEFVAKQNRRAEADDQRRRAVIRALQPVVEDLREIGITVDSVDDLPSRHAPLNDSITSVLRRWLGGFEDPRATEQVVRALAAARPGFPGTELTDLFDQASDPSLRWAIANTVALARPSDVTDWLRSRVRDRSIGKPREMLILAAAELLPPEEARSVLRDVAPDFPGHAAMALRNLGTQAELQLLDSIRGDASEWETKEIDRTAAAIRRRSATDQG